MSLEPANTAAAVQVEHELSRATTNPTPALRVYVSTGRGNRAIYLDGEPLTVRFSATRRCFVKVFHVDATGHTTLLYPNGYAGEEPIHGGTVYQLPDPRKPFELRLGRPFGTEFIWVVASTTEFARHEAAFVDLGHASRAFFARLEAAGGAIAPEEAGAAADYTIIRR